MGGAEYVMLGSLIVLSIYDLRIRKIPLAPVLLLGALTVGYRLWSGVSFSEVAAGLIPGSIILLLAWATKESIGYGDGWVLVVLGLFCGTAKTMAILGLALLFAALLAMVLLVSGRVGRKTELPFLPCLCSGYMVCLLW